MTESRKLATITVSATARLRLATTPLTATAAVPRMRRARSMASIGSTCCANSGAMRSYNSAINQGSAVMPPTSRHATERYAAIGMPKMAGAVAKAMPSATSAIASQWPLPAAGAAPSPFSVCASGNNMAARAGHQPPTSAAITPRPP